MVPASRRCCGWPPGFCIPKRGPFISRGVPSAHCGRTEIARQVAVVPQQPVMPEAFTGWDIVVGWAHPPPGAVPGTSPVDEAIVQRALALVDATHLAERRVGEISGGERQRLLLARAIAQEPAVLLLDEPTTHLDLPHQLTILDLALRFARESDLAILGVFHDLNLAAAYCDEISLMREGRILVHGTPQTVLSADWIATVYGLDVTIVPHPQSGRPVVLPPAARPHHPHDEALTTSSSPTADPVPRAAGRMVREAGWAR